MESLKPIMAVVIEQFPLWTSYVFMKLPAAFFFILCSHQSFTFIIIYVTLSVLSPLYALYDVVILAVTRASSCIHDLMLSVKPTSFNINVCWPCSVLASQSRTCSYCLSEQQIHKTNKLNKTTNCKHTHTLKHTDMHTMSPLSFVIFIKDEMKKNIHVIY